MKIKVLLSTIIILVMTASLTAAIPCVEYSFSLTAGAGSKPITNDLFQTVYGKSGVLLYADFGFKLTDSIEAFAHTDYFSIDGQLTYTQEPTTLKIIPIEMGFRYLITIDPSCGLRLYPYIGAGAGYYTIKETNIIGTYKKNKVGFFGEGGFRFFVLNKIFLDAKLKYTAVNIPNESLEADHLDPKIKIGGISYMGGIGIAF